MPEKSPGDPQPRLRLAPGFGELLAPFDPEVLARQPDTIYGLDAELRLAMFNPAWFAFADANGGMPAVARGWGLGRGVLEACPPVIRDFYAENLATALRKDQRWDHEYECSGPDVWRRMRLSAYPLRGGGGLLMVNALVFEEPTDAPAGDRPSFDLATYIDGHGIVHQCSHCRKVRRTSGPRHWDWVPALVAGPQILVSHDLCDVCLDYYYPAPADAPDAD